MITLISSEKLGVCNDIRNTDLFNKRVAESDSSDPHDLYFVVCSLVVNGQNRKQVLLRGV